MKYNKILAGLLTGFATLGLATGCGSDDDDSDSSSGGDGDGDGDGAVNKSISCTDGDTQNSATRCGFNDRGRMVEECTANSWALTSSCADPDLCESGMRRDEGETACGQDDKGVLEQYCDNGQWHNAKKCIDAGGCAHKDTRAGKTACGFEDKGVLEEYCEGGVWMESKTCLNDEGCAHKDERTGPKECGLNQAGRIEQYCDAGEWKNKQKCIGDDDECKNGSTKKDDKKTCGVDDSGFVESICVDGQWEVHKEQGETVCADAVVCKKGETRVGKACGPQDSGTWLDECDDKGNSDDTDNVWSQSTTCQDADDCKNGNTQPGIDTEMCGLNDEGIWEQLCDAGKWTTPMDDDDDAVCEGDIDICIITTVSPESCGDNSEGLADVTCTDGATDADPTSWVTGECIYACNDSVCSEVEKCGGSSYCEADCGACVPIEFSLQITTESDTAEEDVVTGNTDFASSDLEFGVDDSPSQYSHTFQTIGLRFASVDIPAGAQIKTAIISFIAKEDSETDAPKLSFTVQAADNPDTFVRASIVDSVSARDISTRPTIGEEVLWTPTSWTEDVTYPSPPLVSLVQKLVDRGGWSSGNAMVFIVEEVDPTTTELTRRAMSDGGSGPVLDITYTP